VYGGDGFEIFEGDINLMFEFDDVEDEIFPKGLEGSLFIGEVITHVEGNHGLLGLELFS
jgi:hypothetical protein